MDNLCPDMTCLPSGSTGWMGQPQFPNTRQLRNTAQLLRIGKVWPAWFCLGTPGRLNLKTFAESG